MRFKAGLLLKVMRTFFHCPSRLMISVKPTIATITLICVEAKAV